ncbi:MAG: hypothetical protein HYY23_11680 [Verrucomicrobia bacterium]|nr:hypothetical protein [Verrucomicrobiota bacterium]
MNNEAAKRLLERTSEQNIRKLEEQIQHLKSKAVRAPAGGRIKCYEAIQDLTDRRSALLTKLDEVKDADVASWESAYSVLNEAYDELAEAIARTRFLLS